MNGYTLHLGKLKQLRFSGWKGFRLFFRDSHGNLSSSPVIKGIYSVGGKDGVKPWMDIEYSEELGFLDEKETKDGLILSSNSLDRKLFKYLGNIIPSGGHLMVSYEGGQLIHTNTIRSLSMSIPPAATSLGFLIFQGGFQLIKDWYLSEGGHEGPRKLWGEKAPDDIWAETFYKKTAQQIFQFLEIKQNLAHEELLEPAVKRSKEVLEIIKKHYKGTLELG
ncbi:MAG: DUF1122 domain-containing protein [Candidatus Aminicenantes bacterium]|nr:DUF1122 domain-containing protein [Candidatus Aminicenantes bacterium]